jgi:phosphate transport system ATP-binding protein
VTTPPTSTYPVVEQPPPPLLSYPPPAPVFTDTRHVGGAVHDSGLFAPTGVQPVASTLDGRQPSTLEAKAVSAWFGKRKVLERCSLTMPAGVVTALIGPSGCGKSTFLRTLNRMHEVIPSAQIAGRIELDGEDIYSPKLSVTTVRTHIGMVFQKPNPFPSMTIRQNVLAGLRLSGTDGGDKNALVEDCLTRAGLWDEVKDRLNEGGMALSGGQQQRLCIARSLAVRPRILLMDEPCSALDPISTRVVEETIAAIGHDVTIVIVTHNMQQAARVSQQCAFFCVEDQGEPGRIVERGPTTKMFENPDDQRTLDYVTGRFG